jgi:hypothetical protein
VSDTPRFFHYTRFISGNSPPIVVTVHPDDLIGAILEVGLVLREMQSWLTPQQRIDLQTAREMDPR